MGKDLTKVTHTFLFCDGGSCQKEGGEISTRAARAYLRNNGLWGTTHTIKTRCNGRCEDAPTCIVQNGEYWYKKINSQKIQEIVKSHTQKNEPIAEYLLYRGGDEKMYSENELAPIKPKDFELIDDKELGEVYMTKGFSSDQYLFPLFLYLENQKLNGVLQTRSGTLYSLANLKEAKYETAYTLELTFNKEDKIDLIIGAIPKTVDTSVIDLKITQTFYYTTTDNQEKGVLFKNKKGKFVASLKFDAKSEEFWEYCLKNQLLGLQNPIVLKD